MLIACILAPKPNKWRQGECRRGPEAGLPRDLGRGTITTLVMARNRGNADSISLPIDFQKTRALKVGFEMSLWKSPRAVWCLFQTGVYIGWLGSAASLSQMLLMGLPPSAV